jgi:hypothetical protein
VHVPSTCYREQMVNICYGIFASWVTQQFSVVSYLIATSSIELNSARKLSSRIVNTSLFSCFDFEETMKSSRTSRSPTSKVTVLEWRLANDD